MPETAVQQDSVSLEADASGSTAHAAAGRSYNAHAPVWTSLQTALAAIAMDSVAAPATYLEDTVVPHGGE